MFHCFLPPDEAPIEKELSLEERYGALLKERDQLRAEVEACKETLGLKAQEWANSFLERDLLKAQCEKLAEALEFYADKTNYNLCDEGRNYMSHYVCYEMNKESYADDELGTMARKTLAEYRGRFKKT